MAVSFWFLTASAFFVAGMVLVFSSMLLQQSVTVGYVGIALLVVGYVMVLIGNYSRYIDWT